MSNDKGLRAIHIPAILLWITFVDNSAAGGWPRTSVLRANVGLPGGLSVVACLWAASALSGSGIIGTGDQRSASVPVGTAGNHRAAASALSSGLVLKAIAAPGSSFMNGVENGLKYGKLPWGQADARRR